MDALSVMSEAMTKYRNDDDGKRHCRSRAESGEHHHVQENFNFEILGASWDEVVERASNQCI